MVNTGVMRKFSLIHCFRNGVDDSAIMIGYAPWPSPRAGKLLSISATHFDKLSGECKRFQNNKPADALVVCVPAML